MPDDLLAFQERLAAVEARIHRVLATCGRQRSEILLVAVSKKFSAPILRQAYQAGVRVFGENYVQEFADKQPQLLDLPDARFHLIGHLQTNKARVAAELFPSIQTVDSEKLIHRLAAAAADLHRSLDVMFEVKLAEEVNKTGARPEEIPALLTVARQYHQLRVTGLMTIPPWSDDPEVSRPFFQRLASLGKQHGVPGLSMGMSADFEVAIQEGATVIRVGTALFGPRPRPQNTQGTAV